jgi:hypothetical protein
MIEVVLIPKPQPGTSRSNRLRGYGKTEPIRTDFSTLADLNCITFSRSRNIRIIHSCIFYIHNDFRGKFAFSHRKFDEERVITTSQILTIWRSQ